MDESNSDVAVEGDEEKDGGKAEHVVDETTEVVKRAPMLEEKVQAESVEPVGADVEDVQREDEKEIAVAEAAEVAEARAEAGQDGEDLLAETSDGSDSDIEPSYI